MSTPDENVDMDIPSEKSMLAIREILLVELEERAPGQPAAGAIASNPQTTLDLRIRMMNGAIRSLTTSVADLRSQRNTLSQMNRLPSEIFLPILTLSLPDSSCTGEHWSNEHTFKLQDSYYARLYRLSTVSRHWRVSIHGTSSLWHLVDSRYPEAVWRSALKRSQSHPLTVISGLPVLRHSNPWDRNILDSEASRPFYDAVVLECGRWGDALLRLTGTSVKDLHRLEDATAPTLRHFQLHVNSSVYPQERVVHLFQGHTPNLRVLQLSHLDANWDQPLLCNLVKLELQNVGGLSTRKLFDGLRNCPDLEELVVRAQIVPADEDGPIAAIHLGRLLCLAHSSLGSGDAVIDRLITAARIPKCTSCTVSFATFQDKSSPTLRTLLFERLDPPLRAHLDRGLPVNVTSETLDRFFVGITLGEDLARTEGGMFVGLHRASLRLVLLEWLLPNLRGRKNRVSLDLKCNAQLSDLGGADQMFLLRGLPGLERLTLRSLRRSILENLLGAISHQESGGWVSPQLHTLELYDCAIGKGEGLLDMVVRRTAPPKLGVAPGSVGAREYPAQLRRLFIRNCGNQMTDETFSIIHSLVGEGAIDGSDQVYEIFGPSNLAPFTDLIPQVVAFPASPADEHESWIESDLPPDFHWAPPIFEG